MISTDPYPSALCLWRASVAQARSFHTGIAPNPSGNAMNRQARSFCSELADVCLALQMGLSMRVMQQLLQRISAAENSQVGVSSQAIIPGLCSW